MSPDLDALPTDRVFSHFDVIDGVARALKQRSPAGRVAVVGSDFLPVKYANQLIATCPSIDFVYDDDLVRSLRRIKSPAELDCFREAGAVCTQALNVLMESLTSGATQTEADAGDDTRWRQLKKNDHESRRHA